MGIWGDALKQTGAQTIGSAATGVLGMGLGLITAKAQDRRQLKQQRKLQDLQLQGNEQALEQQRLKEMQMWEDTNYKAQMMQLEKAGLNPGLLYGMSGGGATTVGGGGAGVSGTQVSSGEIGQGIQSALQLKMMDAQLKVLESQANKNNADAKATGGYQKELAGAQITNLLQAAKTSEATQKLTEMQTEISEVQKDIAQATKEEAISMVSQNMQINEQNIRRMVRQNTIDAATMQTQINQVKANYAKTLAEKALLDEHKNLSIEERREIEAKIQQGWESLRLMGMSTSEKDREGFNARMNDWIKSINLGETGERILQAVGIGALIKSPGVGGGTPGGIGFKPQGK